MKPDKKDLLPEDQRVTRLSDTMMSAKPLIDAARHLRNKLDLVRLGCAVLDPMDLFFIEAMKHHHYGVGSGGTASLLPDDVADVICQIQASAAEARKRAK